MKKLVSLLIVLAAIIALCIWQKNNIEALLMFISNDEEGVNKIIEDNSKELEEKIKEYAPVIPRYFTPEEEAMIASGELSIEEATALLMGENTAAEDEMGETAEAGTEDKINETEKTDEEKSKEPSVKKDKNKTEPEKITPVNTDKNKTEPGKVTPGKTDGDKTEPGKVTPGKTTGGSESTINTESEESKIIKKYTAQFYSLKAYYSGQLSSLESQAKSEYINARKNKQSGVTKASVAKTYIGKAYSLQSECDGKVSTLLSGMKSELKAVGGDLSILETIKNAYDSEKAARKAQYMNMIK